MMALRGTGARGPARGRWPVLRDDPSLCPSRIARRGVREARGSSEGRAVRQAFCLRGWRPFEEWTREGQRRKAGELYPPPPETREEMPRMPPARESAMGTSAARSAGGAARIVADSPRGATNGAFIWLERTSSASQMGLPAGCGGRSSVLGRTATGWEEGEGTPGKGGQWRQ